MKNVLKPLSKTLLIPLLLTASASATDAAINKKAFRLGTHSSDLAKHSKLIIFKEEMNDIRKIIKSYEESGLLVKSASETIQNEAKEQSGRLGTFCASLLANILTGKDTIRADEGTIRAGQKF